MNLNYLKISALILLLIWLGFFIVQKIDLTTADLGRHIKNGQMIVQGNFNVLKTNFYSYTYPDYSFTNHHWLSGVIFSLASKTTGFLGLHLFFLILTLLAFLIFFWLAQKQGGFITAFILSLIFIPLLAYRREIRPEVFTYVFSGIFLLILWNYTRLGISKNWFFILPIIQILWVNAHIYFFLGPCIAAAFLLERIIKNKEARPPAEVGPPKILAAILLITLFACLINPFGLRGALQPFNVFENYGYRVLENQSIWFLENLGISNPSYLLFKILFPILVLSFVLVFFKKRERFALANSFLALGISFMALLAVRNLALFGFFALPILANNIKIIAPNINLKTADNKTGAGAFCLVLAIIIFSVYSSNLPITQGKFGLGLTQNNNKSAQFFIQNNIQGPIFNNYDIGGYLIFHLFPKERVFVDNRPETYPSSFFEQTYVAMQDNEQVWQEKQEQYQFNSIFFYRLDATPWAQKFLVERIKDDLWTAVFVDNYAIIFVKRNDLSKEVINQYEINKEQFRIITK